MGNPPDIPQDVWDAARYALFGAIPASAFAVLPYKDVVHMGRCARAILAERERCADILRARPDPYGIMAEIINAIIMEPTP